MKSRNRSTAFTVGCALVFLLAPFLPSTVLSNSASRITNARGGEAAAIVRPRIVVPSEGVTHVIEFAEEPTRKPKPGQLLFPSADVSTRKTPHPGLNPRLITICVGDSVEFKNNWIARVNAFSYSKALKFDTGRFKPGESRTVGPFQQAGLVRIYDEIHSTLKGIINVVDCSSKGRDKSIKEGNKLIRASLEAAGEYLGEDDQVEDSSNKTGTSPGNIKASVRNGNGLQIATFDTIYGQVVVDLPDDIAAGEASSGSIETKPAGKTPEEKANNQVALNDLQLVFDGARVPVNQPTFSWIPPTPETSPTPASYPLRLFDVKVGMELAIVEIAPEGRIIGGEWYPESKKTHPDFLWWPVGQQGRPKEIYGPFDGYFNTTLIMIGGQEARKLAESPRKLIFESPNHVVGVTEILLREGNAQVKGEYRSVGIKLSAPTTTLPKSGSTTVTGVVTGVGGSKQPIPIHVECTGQVDMQGGNSQTLHAPPSSDPNATFIFNLKITATKGPGPFTVTGRVTKGGTEKMVAVGAVSSQTSEQASVEKSDGTLIKFGPGDKVATRTPGGAWFDLGPDDPITEKGADGTEYVIKRKNGKVVSRIEKKTDGTEIERHGRTVIIREPLGKLPVPQQAQGGCQSYWQRKIHIRVVDRGGIYDGSCAWAQRDLPTRWKSFVEWWRSGAAYVSDASGLYPEQVAAGKARAENSILHEAGLCIAQEQANCPRPCKFRAHTSVPKFTDECQDVVSLPGEYLEHLNHNVIVTGHVEVHTSCGP